MTLLNSKNYQRNENMSINTNMKIVVLFTHVFTDTGCLITEYGMNCPVPCSNNCIGMCSHVTGHCEAGCQAGWRGPTCDTSMGSYLIVSFFCDTTCNTSRVCLRVSFFS